MPVLLYLRKRVLSGQLDHYLQSMWIVLPQRHFTSIAEIKSLSLIMLISGSAEHLESLFPTTKGAEENLKFSPLMMFFS